jgi:hypothetical protein
MRFEAHSRFKIGFLGFEVVEIVEGAFHVGCHRE